MSSAQYSLLLPEAWLIIAFITAEIFVLAGKRQALYAWTVLSACVAALWFAVNAASGDSARFFYNSY